MRFSNIVDYKGDSRHPAGQYFIVKTGRKNIRILKPGEDYEKSFVVPIKKVSNRRPAEYVEEDLDCDDEDLDLEGTPELAEQVELTDDETEELEDEFQPQ